MNTKLHAVTDSVGRPIRLFITAGQMSDYVGARVLSSSLPAVKWLIADRGYDADWFREALQDKGIRPGIPGRKSRGKPVRRRRFQYLGRARCHDQPHQGACRRLSIDTDRLYTTGQLGGCMLSIAMNIKYPDFFAASFLVAGQWDPELVRAMVDDKLWILVSQDDPGAFPGQNAITAVLEAEGAQISRATWDARWSAEEFRAAFDQIDAEGSPINYVTFAPGTVIPEGASTAGASGHRNTWRVAYAIEPIREWIFRQSKT